MNITTRQIRGKGRGKLIGYPTINLEISQVLQGSTLQEGIWAAWVVIAGKKYQGALHFGPVPTFGESAKSLEVFLLDASDDDLVGVEGEAIELIPVARLRDIENFDTTEALTAQISRDVEDVRKLLSDTTIG